MKRSQIDRLLAESNIPDPCRSPQLAETHISWVILGEQFAFKIKKPLKLPFLDFSTLEKRCYYCQRELLLNDRLTSDMYLDVLPVRKEDEDLWIGDPAKGEVIDYALRMRRMETEREMDRMLKAGKVEVHHIRQLAEVIGAFHQRTHIITSGIDPGVMRKEFNAIDAYFPFVESLGDKKRLCDILKESIAVSNGFLDRHRSRILQRVEKGFVRDCHGDLHSGNIFLYEPPVIFDCIEFNDEFRQIDVLSEVAFLVMDLEYYGYASLSEAFMAHYLKAFEAIGEEEDWHLFAYFKLYRANVRTKVHLLEARQATTEAERTAQLDIASQYGQLMKSYSDHLIQKQSNP